MSNNANNTDNQSNTNHNIIEISSSELPCLNFLQLKLQKYCVGIQQDGLKKIGKEYNIKQSELETLVGLSTVGQCHAKTAKGNRCSRKFLEGENYCGNHLKNLPNGDYI